MPRDDLVPREERIFGWIEEVFSQGVRRPGYPAGRWAETWIAEQFRAFGLERVRAEPVELPLWEPRSWSLIARASDGRELDVPCFPLPHGAPASRLEAALVPFDREHPERVRGAVALYDEPLLRLPHTVLAGAATWSYDPEGTWTATAQVLPFGPDFQEVMEPAIAAGAAGFVGVLRDYPGDSRDYYVPYDGVARPIPGVWVNHTAGARLRELLGAGPVRVLLDVDAVRETTTTYNIVGELPGADEEIVVIGSHHDGPWSSAVEDASGIALVLAQAAYWSRVPVSERPHRLLFVLNSGHMAGGAGARAFIDAHRDELSRVVLEVHLEHAASEFEGVDGALRPTGHPEARWWFTTRNPRLEGAVRDAIEAERLTRSLILRPDIFGPQPTTDGGFFHVAGVPLVNYLTAPFYLFDAMDMLDKIHRPSLVPVTRAAVRIIESTAGVSAASMRAGVIPGAAAPPLRPA